MVDIQHALEQQALAMDEASTKTWHSKSFIASFPHEWLKRVDEQAQSHKPGKAAPITPYHSQILSPTHALSLLAGRSSADWHLLSLT